MQKDMIRHITFLTLVLFTFLLVNLSSQPREKAIPSSRSSIQLEKNIIFNDSSSICYLSYRIPYSSLVFVKDDDKYSGGLTLDFEIKRDDKIVDRKSSSKSVVTDSYEGTLSEENFIEGVISLDVSKNDYVIKPFLTVTNTDRNIPLDSMLIQQKVILKEKFGHPIVVQSEEAPSCSSSDFQLVNFANSIPYSPNSYILLIPVLEENNEEIKVKIDQEGKNILDKSLTDFIDKDFILKECENKVILQKENNLKKVKYFLVKDFSYLMKEGNGRLMISVGNEKPVEFGFTVIWQNKPRTLMNPEFAIQLLGTIEKENIVDELLNADKKDYSKVLNKYWDDKIPNKKVAFNELMYEFYKRADYAMKNFGSVSNSNGAKSDRGKIFIRFGKPDEIKREYSTSNAVTEIWKYIQLKREFIFTDRTGLGNYTLD